MIEWSANTKTKFALGTTQNTLQNNRVEALSITLELIKAELGQDSSIGMYSKDDFKEAIAPVTSLISKS